MIASASRYSFVVGLSAGMIADEVGVWRHLLGEGNEPAPVVCDDRLMWPRLALDSPPEHRRQTVLPELGLFGAVGESLAFVFADRTKAKRRTMMGSLVAESNV